MYATRDDMQARFGERELVSLTDRDRDGNIDDAALDAALAQATAEIDGYLGGRYPLPLARTPAVLTGYACDIARYRLCSSGALTTDDIRDRYRDAVRFLEHVAAGRVTLGGMPGGSVATPARTVQFQGAPTVFGRNGGL